MNCKTHGYKLEIRWYAEGTPRQDFDGFYCPECEKAERAERKANEHWLKLVGEAEDLERAIRLRKPHSGIKGWEAVNRWYSNTCLLKKYF